VSSALRSGGLLIFDLLNRHSYKLAMKRLSYRNNARFRPDFRDKYVNVFSWNEVQQALAGLALTSWRRAVTDDTFYSEHSEHLGERVRVG